MLVAEGVVGGVLLTGVVVADVGEGEDEDSKISIALQKELVFCCKPHTVYAIRNNITCSAYGCMPNKCMSSPLCIVRRVYCTLDRVLEIIAMYPWSDFMHMQKILSHAGCHLIIDRMYICPHSVPAAKHRAVMLHTTNYDHDIVYELPTPPFDFDFTSHYPPTTSWQIACSF